MIQLRLNPYSDTEKRALDWALFQARQKFLAKYCGVDPCTECRYRHICNDLENVVNYTDKLVNEVFGGARK